MSTPREQQVAELLATRERQVERFEAIEALRHHTLTTGQVTNELRTHHGYGCEVKSHLISCSCDLRTSGVCDCGYEIVQDSFWQDAEHIAADYDFEGVEAAGRQGGWLVVSPQPHTDDMYEEDVAEYEHTRLGPLVLDIKQLLCDYEEAWARGEHVSGEKLADMLARTLRLAIP